MADTHLLFVWKPTGYELEEREGEPPEQGAEVELNGTPMTVAKVATSPLPGDSRRCVYLQPRS